MRAHFASTSHPVHSFFTTTTTTTTTTATTTLPANSVVLCSVTLAHSATSSSLTFSYLDPHGQNIFLVCDRCHDVLDLNPVQHPVCKQVICGKCQCGCQAVVDADRISLPSRLTIALDDLRVRCSKCKETMLRKYWTTHPCTSPAVTLPQPDWSFFGKIDDDEDPLPVIFTKRPSTSLKFSAPPSSVSSPAPSSVSSPAPSSVSAPAKSSPAPSSPAPSSSSSPAPSSSSSPAPSSSSSPAPSSVSSSAPSSVSTSAKSSPAPSSMSSIARNSVTSPVPSSSVNVRTADDNDLPKIIRWLNMYRDLRECSMDELERDCIKDIKIRLRPSSSTPWSDTVLPKALNETQYSISTAEPTAIVLSATLVEESKISDWIRDNFNKQVRGETVRSICDILQHRQYRTRHLKGDALKEAVLRGLEAHNAWVDKGYIRRRSKQRVSEPVEANTKSQLRHQSPQQNKQKRQKKSKEEEEEHEHEDEDEDEAEEEQNEEQKED